MLEFVFVVDNGGFLGVDDLNIGWFKWVWRLWVSWCFGFKRCELMLVMFGDYVMWLCVVDVDNCIEWNVVEGDYVGGM